MSNLRTEKTLKLIVINVNVNNKKIILVHFRYNLI